MSGSDVPALSRVELAEVSRFGIHDMDIEADRYERRGGGVS